MSENSDAEIYKIVRIRWLDAAHYSGWHNMEQLERMSESGSATYTIGYLVKENGSGVWIASSVSTYRVGDVLFIPRGMILDRWEMGDEGVE